MTLESHSIFKYQITLVSKRTYDILSFLQMLMDNKNISDDRDKVLQKIFNVGDEVVITSKITKEAAASIPEVVEISETVRTITPIWVAGVYIPVDSSDFKRTPIANGGAEIQN
jgi:vacuolar-type H+-ATPase subunit D/Vma8